MLSDLDYPDYFPRKLLTNITIANTSLIEASTSVAPYNYGLVAGVGLGVFLTCMMIIFGIILCVIGTATPVFFVFLFLGILIPLITFLIVALAPLHKNQTVKTDTRTDPFVAARIVFLIFMVLFSLVSLMKLVEYYLGVNLKAKGAILKAKL